MPEGPDRTRVDLEHRGLEAYGDAMDQMHQHFDSGWPAESWRVSQGPRRAPDVAYHVALYLHLLSLFVLIGAITMVGLCYLRLRVAESLTDARRGSCWQTTSVGRSPWRSSVCSQAVPI